METKETSIKATPTQGIINNDEYYKYIFKKTEKIACAVFYVSRENRSSQRDDRVIDDLEDAARALADSSIESLKETRLRLDEVSRTLAHALVRLETKLRIAHAARILTAELLQVFLREIEAVHRVLRKYVEPELPNPLSLGEAVLTKSYARDRQARPRPSIAQSTQVFPGRRERILAIIKDKVEASIKDIGEVITDCSEKTIQRELNALIKDNIVHREGERRWSKYKLVQ